MEVNFWDPKIETMPQQDLKALQLEKLKKVVTLVYERVPHYRKKFEEAKVKPEDIKSLEDVVRLPFTT
ncbi:MAG: Phenylacetate-CoA ligase, partial [Thermodesulfobacterium commune]